MERYASTHVAVPVTKPSVPVTVVIEAMRTCFFQRAAAVYFAVAGQIEMIADVAEATVTDVVAAAILKAQGHALRRG